MDSNGTEIDNSGIQDETGNTSFFIYESGTYYLNFHSFGHNGAAYNLYSANVFDDEAGHTFDDALSAEIGTPLDGAFHSGWDNDYYSFELFANNTYTFTLARDGYSGASGEIYFRHESGDVYDGNEIVGNERLEHWVLSNTDTHNLYTHSFWYLLFRCKKHSL